MIEIATDERTHMSRQVAQTCRVAHYQRFVATAHAYVDIEQNHVGEIEMRGVARWVTDEQDAPFDLIDVECSFVVMCDGDEIQAVPIRQRTWHAMTCTDEAQIVGMLQKELV